MFCTHEADIKWRSAETVSLSTEELVDVFREELEKSGWPVAGTTDNLFSGYDISGAELLVAARITSIKEELCMYDSRRQRAGSMRINVEWQIYSVASKSITRKIHTKGSANIETPQEEVEVDLLNESFSVAINNLLADKSFINIVKKSKKVTQPPSSVSRRFIPNKSTIYSTIGTTLVTAKKSTLIIRTAMGHGSGFVIGDGSLVITNAHVVGEAQHVTVITNDGIELKGDVLNISKSRDVALIEINGVRLQPFHINEVIPASGEKVYVIGSPLKEKLAGTVTDGIISGTRVLDGYLWIQSNAATNHGNSGGPLIDVSGSVIGITSQGFEVGGSPVGLNLFIPIGEALSYLGLRLR